MKRYLLLAAVHEARCAFGRRLRLALLGTACWFGATLIEAFFGAPFAVAAFSFFVATVWLLCFMAFVGAWAALNALEQGLSEIERAGRP